MKDVAVIGCGGLGARHVEALGKTKEPLRVWAIDTSAAALDKCRAIVEKSARRNLKTEFRYESSVDSLPKTLSFTVIATPSRPRLQALKALLNGRKIDGLLLEKILFSKLSDYDECEALMKNGFPPAWVNTSMPMFPFYGGFKSFVGKEPVALNLVGGSVRIASSLIHYIDYIHYLTGARHYETFVDPKHVKLTDSKRPGYKELEGELYLRFEDGSSIHISTRTDPENPFHINLAGQNAHMIVREKESKTWIAKREEGWDWKEIETVCPYQSDLTATLVDQFFEKKTVPLTDLATSLKLHRPLVKTLLNIHSAVAGSDGAELPFT